MAAAALVIIVIGNAVVYAMVRWFIMSDLIRKWGGANVPNVVGLGICSMLVESFFLLNAQQTGGFVTAWSKIAPVLIFAVVTALPWAFLYIRLLGEMTDHMAESVVGINVLVKEKVNLKAVYALIQNGEMAEAVKELESVKELNPQSTEPLFVLASIAHGERDYDKERKYYREIVANESFPIDSRINAAQSLADLLKDIDDTSYLIKKMEKEVARLSLEKEQKFAQGKPGGKKGEDDFNAKLLDLNEARRFSSRGDFEAAVPIMKAYIEKNPEEHRILFELVSLYEKQGLNDEAMLWLQKVISKFGDNDFVWGDAMLRLAGLREHVDGDIESAKALLNNVSGRLKYSNQGKVARLHLRDLQDKPES